MWRCRLVFEASLELCGILEASQRLPGIVVVVYGGCEVSGGLHFAAADADAGSHTHSPTTQLRGKVAVSAEVWP